jgi:hypothetical protein
MSALNGLSGLSGLRNPVSIGWEMNQKGHEFTLQCPKLFFNSFPREWRQCIICFCLCDITARVGDAQINVKENQRMIRMA